MTPEYFKTPAAFRAWLARNHARVDELWVGLHKKDSGLPSITYPEALDLALCFGWIDGVRRKVNETSYTVRFTPRRPGSHWSAVNIRRATELQARGLMAPPGLWAFERRDRATVPDSWQDRVTTFDPDLERRFRARKRAWAFFGAQPPGYRRTATWWVMSAKKEETRRRRLATLIALSAKRERLPGIAPASARKPGRPGG